jgi:hypothetical protein
VNFWLAAVVGSWDHDRACQGTSFQLSHTWSKVNQQTPKFIQNFLMLTAFNFMCTKMEDDLKFELGDHTKDGNVFMGKSG